MNIRNKLINILENNGIYIDPQELEKDIDLREYITDSLQFVSLIVEIEREMDIEFPNELMLFDKIASLNGFSRIIESIISGEYVCDEVLEDEDDE